MERTDSTGFGNIVVIQEDKTGYGVDSVLLAAFAAGETGAPSVTGGSRAADLGTGSGIVAFILHHKTDGAIINGFDVQPSAVERARMACRLNGLTTDIDFFMADVKDIPSLHPDLQGSFDAVLSNPPYFRMTPDEPGAADPDSRYIARHETTAGLSDFISCAAFLLKDSGSLYIVHRPDRLADIICAMRSSGIEPKTLQLVAPKHGRAANIALIHGVKGARSELKLLPELAVHTEDGGYTAEILRIYERK